MRLARGLILPLVLSGCMVGPDYQRAETPVIQDWHADASYKPIEQASLAEQQWLDLFQDDQLQSVVQQALQSNRQLLLAVEQGARVTRL